MTYVAQHTPLHVGPAKVVDIGVDSLIFAYFQQRRRFRETMSAAILFLAWLFHHRSRLVMGHVIIV